MNDARRKKRRDVERQTVMNLLLVMAFALTLLTVRTWILLTSSS